MNLLNDPWIPVRAGGTGKFCLLTFEELVCGQGDWWVSLPRDDLELATIQLLVCMAQVMFMPETDSELLDQLRRPLTPERFADGTGPFREWFDLDHPTQPFMQTRGTSAKKITPIQKLLPGLPEGNNHAFFNEPGEVPELGVAAAAIALFNQASNSPSFGGGFKAGLRGASPITVLTKGDHLRQTVFSNTLTRARVLVHLPNYGFDINLDRPTWVMPINKAESAHDIGLVRGLFWQPAHLELLQTPNGGECSLTGLPGPTYDGFQTEKFDFKVIGIWPHPHGSRVWNKTTRDWKFSSFTTEAPAWNWLSQFFVASPLNTDATEGSTPAATISQAAELVAASDNVLHILVGGYRIKQAAVIERRHELFSFAQGWSADSARIQTLVSTGKLARKILREKLWLIRRGDKKKKILGIGIAIEERASQPFYARTEHFFLDTLRDTMTWSQWQQSLKTFKRRLSDICCTIFEELTDPYTAKPEFVPIIAKARQQLQAELSKL